MTMNSLNIEGSRSTPQIRCDADTGVITMRGDAYPENSFEFFNGLIDWVAQYLAETSHPLMLELHLVYMNTSSVKAMMDIFDMLEEAHQQGKDVAVHWHYDPENERVVELAEEFREDLTFPFTISSVDE
ncbi:biofilm regulation phosphoprotein SiaC [Zobellella maritima]|uniref:biofilm regulation phosphoprotein SiaC n=1 Tax=Zobellella maritima TaxID=2059725 RepID=UPI0022B7DE9C|nr:biofilm regulation phosphoprotein SiaC [Zobellella maritima]